VVRACRLLLADDKPVFVGQFYHFDRFKFMKVTRSTDDRTPPAQSGVQEDTIPKAMDKDKDLQYLWNFYCEIWSKRGWDLPHALKEWTARQEERLPSPGARDDFRELCVNGCVAEILAIGFASLRWSPQFEDFWSTLYGNPNDRRRVRRNLEKTAKAIEGLFVLPIHLENDEMISKLSKIGHISPGKLSSELRAYAKLLDFIDSFPRETRTRSLADFGKFCLTEYAKQATGRFRDRNVSGLIAEAIGRADYNEVAHRMWRSRNFKRIRSHFQKPSELLAAIHALASAET
jgi:hypothetical protein